jgi:hypothetical protein
MGLILELVEENREQPASFDYRYPTLIESPCAN